MSDNIKEEYTVEIERDPQTGHKISEMWYLDGQLHRLGRPALRRFNDVTGHVYREEFYLYGKRHREHGPAVISRDQETGSIIRTFYYLNGVRQQLPKGPIIP